MKKLICIFLACGFVFANIGKFVIVKGDVEVVRDGKKIKAVSGMIIENQDKINTLGVAKAQIEFSDKTIVSLGKNTSFTINDYLFAQNDSKIDMGVNNGSFKVISGEVGKLARNNFKFQANTATIGIRGTIFAGNVTAKENIIACVQGGITVKQGDMIREVNAGKMVEVMANKISAPKAIDTKKIETISSLDSAKLNDDKVSLNKTVSNVKAINELKQEKADFIQAKLDYVDSKKDSYKAKESDKDIYEIYKKKLSEDKTNNTLDKVNSVFYYSGMYKYNGTSYNNAQAKVDYRVSKANFHLKTGSGYSGFVYSGLSNIYDDGSMQKFKGTDGSFLMLKNNMQNVEFNHNAAHYEGDLTPNPTDRW